MQRFKTLSVSRYTKGAVAICCVILLAYQLALHAQDAPRLGTPTADIRRESLRAEENDQANRKEAEAVMKELASDIDIFGIRQDGTRYQADLIPHRLMKLDNSSRGQVGELWAWGNGGRPIALAEIWSWKNDRDRWGHTMVSTTPGQLIGQIDGNTWRPQKPGLEFHEFDEAPVPSAVREQRAQQMKELAEGFAGYEAHVELKLLPEPIYRYESEGVDGGIFAFVENDDPQAILFIEAVEDPLSPISWRYAVAQCTSGVLHVQYRAQKAVTIAAAADYTGTPADPFWLVWVRTDQPRHEVRPSSVPGFPLETQPEFLKRPKSSVRSPKGTPLDPRYQLTIPTNQFGSEFELVTVDLEGELVARFPGNPTGADPAWSPDGTKVAFMREWDILTMNANGSDVRNLTEDVEALCHNPSWSPDGEQIAFQVSSPELGNVGNIFVVNIDGSKLVNLTEKVERPCWCPRWSPNSDQIAFGFTDPSGGPERLHVLNSDGSGFRQLSEQIATAHSHPAWSPDGKQIALRGSLGGDTAQLFITDAQGRQARPVTSEARFHTFASWSPDGRYIAYFQRDEDPHANDADTPGDLMLFDSTSKTHTMILKEALPIYGTRIAWKPF